MLAFLNKPTFPVFSPPTYFNPAFILRFYLSFIFYLAFIYYVLLFTNIIYHVMRTDTCNKPHTLRDAVTGRNRKYWRTVVSSWNSEGKEADGDHRGTAYHRGVSSHHLSSTYTRSTNLFTWACIALLYADDLAVTTQSTDFAPI